LFETTGHVQQAEIMYEGNRSKGMGIVQFEQIDEAETAIGTSIPISIPIPIPISIPISISISHLPPAIHPWLIIPLHATAKFTSYMYGGRPLGVQFNPTWHNFTPSAAKGGSA
jgi:RNA recognition motif. (a.k.a. RRM, RBD, or RNP domain)